MGKIIISLKNAKVKRILQGIIISLTICILSSAVATKIIYDSVFERYDSTTKVTESELLQLIEKRQEHEFMSGDNRLCGWLYTGDGDSLVVISTGFRSSSDDYLHLIKNFTDRGRDVFIFDNTGSCQSEGESAVGFSQAVYDLTAALDYIGKSFEYSDVFLFGHSRGGYAVCCTLANRDDITAAVTVSGINSAMDAIIAPAAEKVGPLAYTNYPLLWLYQSMIFDAKTVSLCAAEELDRTDVPVLVVHGKNDEIVPIDEYSIMSHRHEIDARDVEFIVCDTPGNDGHTSVLYSDDGENSPLMDTINDFFDGSVK